MKRKVPFSQFFQSLSAGSDNNPVN